MLFASGFCWGLLHCRLTCLEQHCVLETHFINWSTVNAQFYPLGQLEMSLIWTGADLCRFLAYFVSKDEHTKHNFQKVNEPNCIDHKHLLTGKSIASLLAFMSPAWFGWVRCQWVWRPPWVRRPPSSELFRDQLESRHFHFVGSFGESGDACTSMTDQIINLQAARLKAEWPLWTTMLSLLSAHTPLPPTSTQRYRTAHLSTKFLFLCRAWQGWRVRNCWEHRTTNYTNFWGESDRRPFHIGRPSEVMTPEFLGDLP